MNDASPAIPSECKASDPRAHVGGSCDNLHVLRIVAVLYWMLLIAWFASLVAAASTAMAAFGTLPPTMRDLGVTVPAFESMAALDATGTEGGRYLAGFVAQRIFDANETLQWIVVPLLVLTMLAQRALRWPARGRANLLRQLLLVAAIACTGYHLIVLAPRMRSELSDYRGAISGSDAASSALHKATFERDHRIADPLLRTTAFLLLGTIALSAWTMTPRTTPHSDRYLGSR